MYRHLIKNIAPGKKSQIDKRRASSIQKQETFLQERYSELSLKFVARLRFLFRNGQFDQ